MRSLLLWNCINNLVVPSTLRSVGLQTTYHFKHRTCNNILHIILSLTFSSDEDSLHYLSPGFSIINICYLPAGRSV